MVPSRKHQSPLSYAFLNLRSNTAMCCLLCLAHSVASKKSKVFVQDTYGSSFSECFGRGPVRKDIIFCWSNLPMPCRPMTSKRSVSTILSPVYHLLSEGGWRKNSFEVLGEELLQTIQKAIKEVLESPFMVVHFCPSWFLIASRKSC